MSLHASKKSPEEVLEKRILLLSFLSGICFVIVELFYAIYSHSQSTLMDALYDASELVFIVLLLFFYPTVSYAGFRKASLRIFSVGICFYSD